MQNDAVLRHQIDAVRFKDMEELREQFQALYGFDCGDTTTRHLRKRIIYRLQELCLGGVDSVDMAILENILTRIRWPISRLLPRSARQRSSARNCTASGKASNMRLLSARKGSTSTTARCSNPCPA